MVIKVYLSVITATLEVKKNQQRAVMILESKNIPYVAIDITDPGQEESRDYMLANATPKEGAKVPVPPQIFNDADYCGDFESLDMSNECDSIGDFLKLTDDEKKVVKIGITGILPEERQRAKELEQQKKDQPAPAPTPVSAPLTNGISNGTEEHTETAPPTEEPTTIADSAPAVEASPADGNEATASEKSSPPAEVAATEATPAETEPASATEGEA